MRHAPTAHGLDRQTVGAALQVEEAVVGPRTAPRVLHLPEFRAGGSVDAPAHNGDNVIDLLRVAVGERRGAVRGLAPLDQRLGGGNADRDRTALIDLLHHVGFAVH